MLWSSISSSPWTRNLQSPSQWCKCRRHQWPPPFGRQTGGWRRRRRSCCPQWWLWRRFRRKFPLRWAIHTSQQYIFWNPRVYLHPAYQPDTVFCKYCEAPSYSEALLHSCIAWSQVLHLGLPHGRHALLVPHGHPSGPRSEQPEPTGRYTGDRCEASWWMMSELTMQLG